MSRRLVCFLACLPAFACAAPAGWAPNITTTATWNDNATNADRSSDIISALELRVDAAVNHRLDLANNNALFVGAALAVEAWPRFEGLDHLNVGPRLAWQHKFGLGALAPIVGVAFAGDAVFTRESDRAGLFGAVSVTLRKRLDAATRFALTQEWSRHDARTAVFDRTGAESSLQLDRDLGERWQLSLIARWRTGDVLSYAMPPRPELVALAPARVPNSTFDRPFVAYSLDARTLTGAFALTRAIDDTTALTLRCEWRQTGRASLRYVNHLVSAALARQF